MRWLRTMDGEYTPQCCVCQTPWPYVGHNKHKQVRSSCVPSVTYRHLQTETPEFLLIFDVGKPKISVPVSLDHKLQLKK